MYEKQSFWVTIPKAIAKSALGALLVSKIRKFSFIMFLTWLNTSSRGLRSGEYGGRTINFAPA